MNYQWYRGGGVRFLIGVRNPWSS